MKENLEFVDLAEVSENNFGKFLIKPLDKGVGITLGNMFRRLLLTQILSTSITGVRIAGTTNEFSTILGVREDVLEILLNLRQIILTGFTAEKTYARLKIQGPSIVTANCIKFDSVPNVKVVNQSQYIATILDTSILEMEFKIESGKNYNLDTSDFNINSADFLTVDKISSPIRSIIFEVNDISDDQNEEELILKVWTNGSISPSKAVIDIADIVRHLFTKINKDNLKVLEEKSVNTDK